MKSPGIFSNATVEGVKPRVVVQNDVNKALKYDEKKSYGKLNIPTDRVVFLFFLIYVELHQRRLMLRILCQFLWSLTYVRECEQKHQL